MEASNSLADSMILDYLRKNCRYAVVKAFAKEKNIDLEKENEASANIKDILDAYKTVQKTKTKESKFVTSTPKPAVSKKPTDSSSSSSDDSDDEADSDDQETGVEKVEKKKLLTKSRKKNSGKILYPLYIDIVIELST